MYRRGYKKFKHTLIYYISAKSQHGTKSTGLKSQHINGVDFLQKHRNFGCHINATLNICSKCLVALILAYFCGYFSYRSMTLFLFPISLCFLWKNP